MIFEDFQKIVKEEAAKAGLKEYELYYKEEETTQIRGMKREISSFSSDMQCGVGFRCAIEGKIGYSATEWFTPEQARELVETAIENAKTLESEEKAEIYGPSDHYEEAASLSLAETDLSQAVLKMQEEALGMDSRVQESSMGIAAQVKGAIRIVNSKGLDLHHEYGVQEAGLIAVVKSGEEQYSGNHFVAKPLERVSLEDLARQAVEKTLQKIDAEVVSTGAYEVIIDGDAMGAIFEAFTPTFQADLVQKGMSLLKGKEGEKIAADCVTVLDDPFYQDSMVKAPFDAEGTATYTKTVIEEGVLKTLLYDQKAAAEAGKATTGNASKAGYASPVQISPYTFYIKPGKDTLDELMAEVGQGVYVTEVTGLHAGTNALTGDFSIECGGFMIEDGKKGKAIRSFTISGNFYEMLLNIQKIGADLQFQAPEGFTMIGSPSLWVGKLSVAGQ